MLRRHTNSVRSASFSPDGTRIVTSSSDTTVRLWDAGTGEPVGEPLRGHTDSVMSVSFSPDGTCIVLVLGIPLFGCGMQRCSSGRNIALFQILQYHQMNIA
jgi:WD40 repeat protein